MTEKTLILVKPDGVERGLIGDVIGRLERKGYRFEALELRTITTETAEEHYAEHKGKPFFDSLVEFITSGPLLAGVAVGPGAIAVWRNLMGATNPEVAAPGTIRGDLASQMQFNVAHGSDSPASAEREIGIFFPGLGT
ncbi:MAG: nucleoside-diphosphate kinase [Actinomycetia bacterium]|nr:nucleoside-diphosphate kinase [Actinomycetes bacterium]